MLRPAPLSRTVGAKQQRKRMAAAATVAALALSVTSCANSDETDKAISAPTTSSSAASSVSASSSDGAAASTSEAATSPSESEAAAEPVTLRVQSWKGGGGEIANVPQVIEAFQKAHPNITVKLEFVAAQGYQQKLNPLFLGGKAADVIMTQPGFTEPWAKSGYLEDLSGETWVSTVAEPVKSFTRYEGKTVAAPLELVGMGLFANMDLLKKAGIETVPATWPEMREALGKLKAAGIKPISIPNKGGFPAWVAAYASAATNVYQKNPNWDADLMAGKTSFSQDWKEPFAQLESLEKDGYVKWKDETGVDEWGAGVADFTSGKSAFWVQGAWNVSAAKKAGLNVQFAPWPGGGEGTKPSSLLLAGPMWAVNADSKQKDAAKKFVDFWTQSDSLLPFLEAEGALSPYTGGKSPETAETKPTAEAVSAGRYTVDAGNQWNTTSAQAISRPALQGFLLGSGSLESTLKKWDTQHKSK